MIIRVEHRERYTVITNQALRDERLSYRSTGLLAYILSFQDDVALSGRALCVAKREGRDAVLAAMAELEDAGYLERRREQLDNGRWQTVCILKELSPSPENPDSVPGNRTVTSHKPSPGKPSPGNPDSKDLSTKDEVLLPPSPWEPEGRLTAEQRLAGLDQVAQLRGAMGWKR